MSDVEVGASVGRKCVSDVEVGASVRQGKYVLDVKGGAGTPPRLGKSTRRGVS